MILKRVLSLILLAWTAAPPDGTVTEVRIAPAGEATEITIFTQGEVRVRDFVLADPVRLIVDVHGATHGLPGLSYDGIARGGVKRLRSSQFRPDVVRLVFDLTLLPEVTAETVAGGTSLRFRNPGGGFEPWSTAGSTRGREMAMDDRTPAPTATRTSPGSAPAGRPVRTVQAERPPSLAALRQEALRSHQPRITVAYDSASMLDVLAGFSEFAGISIVPGAGVASIGVRGVDIRDQQWDVALDAILAAQGLGWRSQADGILIVDKLEDLRSRDTLQTETRVMRINYASADSVAATLKQLATPNRGQVVAYQGANSVIVTDIPPVVARMDTLVRILDKRTPQVSIDAKIIFVDRTDVNEMGIIYDLKDVVGNGNSINDVIQIEDPFNPGTLTRETFVDLGGESVAALTNANDRLINPALQILASTAFGDFSLSAFIEALESQKLSDVQAAPSIQVVDNHNARIQVGERTPIRILEKGAQQAEATVNVQFEDTGIILDVTPHVTNNNQVLLDLSAERSGLKVGLADVGFTFEKQIGETRLLLNNGETAVIGGLTLSEVTRSESGVPGLMNIPLLGNLFKTTKSNEKKQDLIILVTPHIVDAGAPIGD
ncbi:MAG: secretin N-terminal domain-containing protein [Gemmatimonadota bacterium]